MSRLRRIATEYGIALLIMLASLIVIIASQQQLSHTTDEPAHIAAGMEWWQEGRYTLEPIHPPLARIIMAAPLYFSGGRTQEPLPPGPKDFHYLTQAGIEVLFADGKYITHLTLARLALLPFHIVSMWIVFAWSRRLYGMRTALLSLALYASLPPVLAHAALATTDIPYTAMCMLTLYMFVRWLERPDAVRSSIFGIAWALVVATKFSAVIHIPAAMGAILAGRYFCREEKITPVDWRPYARGFYYIIPLALFCLFSVYRFDPFAPLTDGIHDLYEYNKSGRALWLFGPLYNHAVWYFFPVLLFYKTPLPFMVVSFGAVYAALRGHDRKGLDPVLAAIAIVLANMPSHINLGVRHILIVYPLLAIPAGHAAMQAIVWLKHKKAWLAWLMVPLLGMQCMSVALGFPEYISYYNMLSGAHPERINNDSDFDWGQNKLLLRDTLWQRGIDEAYLCFGRGFDNNNASNKLDIRVIPEVVFLPCVPHPASGWIVVGIQDKWVYPNKFSWLDGYEPVQKIGQTLELYHLQEP